MMTGVTLCVFFFITCVTHRQFSWHVFPFTNLFGAFSLYHISPSIFFYYIFRFMCLQEWIYAVYACLHFYFFFFFNNKYDILILTSDNHKNRTKKKIADTRNNKKIIKMKKKSRKTEKLCRNNSKPKSAHWPTGSRDPLAWKWKYGMNYWTWKFVFVVWSTSAQQ